MNQNHILFLSVPMIWALNAFMIKLSASIISLDTYNFLRFLCVTPILFFFKKPHDSFPKLLLISVFWFVLNFYFQNKALSSSLEFGYFALGTITTSLFILVISSILRVDKFTSKMMIGFLFALLGLILIATEVSKDFSKTVGLVSLLLSNASVAIGTVLLKKFKVNPSFSNIGRICLISAFFMFLITTAQNGPLVVYSEIFRLNFSTVGSIIFSAFFVTLVGGKIWIQVVDYFGPSLSSFSMFLFPIFSMCLGLVFLNESLTMMKLLAFFLIVSSVLISVSPREKMKNYFRNAIKFKARP